MIRQLVVWALIWNYVAPETASTSPAAATSREEEEEATTVVYPIIEKESDEQPAAVATILPSNVSEESNDGGKVDEVDRPFEASVKSEDQNQLLRSIMARLEEILGELSRLTKSLKVENVDESAPASEVTLEGEKIEGQLSQSEIQEKLNTLHDINALTKPPEPRTRGPIFPPQIQLIPPIPMLPQGHAGIPSFLRVAENYWINDGYPEASQNVFLALQAPKPLKQAPKKVSKRSANYESFDLASLIADTINNALLDRILTRREIPSVGDGYPGQAFSKDSGYSNSKPSLKFDETVKNSEYLPPLEPSPANQVPNSIDPIDTARQPFSKESGYDYTKPKVGLNLPSAPGSSTESSSLEGNAANNVPSEYLPPEGTGSSTKSPVPAPSSVDSVTQKFDEDTGYDYEKPSVPFETGASSNVPATEKEYIPPPLTESPANQIPVEVKPSDEDGYKYPKPGLTGSASNSDKEYLPPLEQSPTNEEEVKIGSTIGPSTTTGGYDYQKPSSTARPAISSTTTGQPAVDSSATEKEYLPPLESSAAAQIPSKVSPTELPTTAETGYDYPKPGIPFNTGTSSTGRPIPPIEASPSNQDSKKEYLPPLETSPTNQLDSKDSDAGYPQQKFDKDSGYDYSKPSVPFETGASSPALSRDYLPPDQSIAASSIKLAPSSKSAKFSVANDEGDEFFANGNSTSDFDVIDRFPNTN